MTTEQPGASPALSDQLGGNATNWEGMLWNVIFQGIAAKIQRGEPLTDAQQAIKDGAPQDFQWPMPPNVRGEAPAAHPSTE